MSSSNRLPKDLALRSVVDFGAVGDGVHDDTAAIQEAFNIASAFGQAVWFPKGTWTVNAPIVQPDGTTVWCDSAAVFEVNISGSVASDSAFVTRVPVVVGTPTTLSATPVEGSTTLPLTAIPAGTVDGSILEVISAASGLSQFYIAESIASLNVTVDRALVWPWQAGDTVQLVDQKPPCVHWHGNGATMTGTCVLFLFGPAWNSCYRDLRFQSIVGGHADAVAGFHNGSLNCELSGCWADATGAISGFNAGFGVTGAESCRVARNVMLNGGAACSGLKLDDCRLTTFEDNLSSGNAFGLSVGSDALVTTNANQWCVVRGNRFENNGQAMEIANGSSDITFEGNAYLYSTNAAAGALTVFGGGNMANLLFLGEQILGNAGFGVHLTAGAHFTQFIGCNVSGSGNLDVQMEDEFTWIGGVILSTNNVSFRFADATGTKQGSISGLRINNTTTGGASTAILNDGGNLSVNGGTRVELGHASDVGIWSNGVAATGAYTYVTDTKILAVGGAGGTIGLVVVPGQTMARGPNVDLTGVATAIDNTGGIFTPIGTAAKNTAAIPAATTVFFDSPNVQGRAGDVVLVVASISGSGSTPGDSVTIDLRMDGAPFGPAGTSFAQVQTLGSWAGSLSWVFTLPDAATHTFGITAVDTAAGTLSVPISGASVSIMQQQP